MKYKSLIVLLCISSILWGCNGCSDPNTKQARAIVRMPPEERRQALAVLSPERQLDVYMYAASKVEPPLLLANELGADGRSILPALKDRLTLETNETRFTQLMLILVAMSSTNCSLDQRRDILEIVRRRIAGMTAENRRVAEKLLTQIMYPKNKLEPCS